MSGWGRGPDIPSPFLFHSPDIGRGLLNDRQPIAVWLLAFVLVSLPARPAFSGDARADLLAAVQEGDLQRVEDLLSRGADPNSITTNIPHVGKTALMWAAQGRHPEIVRALLRHGADVNAANPKGGTALMYAVTSGPLENVEVLLQRGAQADAAARNGWTPVMLAVAKRRRDVLSLLIAHGADIDRADVYGWTPLMRAAYEGDVEAVELLLRSGANHRIEDRSGNTALSLAQHMGRTRIAQLLRRASRSSAWPRNAPGAARPPWR